MCICVSEGRGIGVKWPEEGTVSPWTGVHCGSRDVGTRKGILQEQQVYLTTISAALFRNLKCELSEYYFLHRPTVLYSQYLEM